MLLLFGISSSDGDDRKIVRKCLRVLVFFLRK